MNSQNRGFQNKTNFGCKSIFTIVASIVTAVGLAQPIITPSNVITYLTAEALVASANGFDYGTPGINKTWDFTHLELIPAGTNDMVMPTQTPYADRFPTGTFCMSYTNTCEAYGYYKCSPDKIEWIGEAFPCIDVVDQIENPKTYITFPYAYDTVIHDSFKSASGETVSFVSTYDAYGTLIMPYGTHYNVIRQKIVCNGQTDYIWFNAYPFYPIIQTATADDTIGVTMHTECGADFQSDDSFTATANANGIFSITANTVVEAAIAVYDVTGNLMASQQMDGQSALINMQHGDAGIYMIAIKMKDRTWLQKIEKCSSIMPGFSNATGLVQTQP